jgi:thioester reductase-like protein
MSLRCAFITGGMGLLGINIIVELLRTTTARLVVLVRDLSDEKRAKFMQDLRAFSAGSWPDGGERSRIELIGGDVAQPGMGLSPALCDRLVPEIDRIYHAAALIKLMGHESEVVATNTGGTRNLLDFATQCRERGRLDWVVHVSTAAVSGDRQGTILERELDAGQHFNNPYEKSKFDAERIVESYRAGGLNVLVMRTSAIVGTVAAGTTNNYNMFYLLLRFLSEGVFEHIPIPTDAHFNLVPVDAAAKAIVLISHAAHEENKNFHVVNPHEINVRHLLESVSGYLGVAKPRFDAEDGITFHSFEGMRGALLHVFYPYLTNRKRFDMQNTDAALNGQPFEWPRIDDALIRTLLDFCLDSGYLRRRREERHETRAHHA